MTASPDLVSLLAALARFPARRATSFKEPAFIALRE
jgi:hypothetical protein